METQAKRPAKTKWGISILLLILGLIVGTAFGSAANVAKLLPFGVDHEEQNSQVVNAITRQEKVVLLKLGMQGIASKSVQSTILGVDVPGTARALYLQYNYSAMLGIDGSAVTVTPETENTYRINVPAFEFLGHSDVEFKKAIEKNGIISLVTPEIDVAEMTTQLLNDTAKDQLIADNREALQDQARVFYTGIIHGIDPEAKIEMSFH